MLLLKHVLIQRLRRKGVFVATDGRALSKLTLTVNPSDYTFVGWLEHLQQEMVDAIVYCEVLKFKYAHLVSLEKLNSDVNADETS
ncbi:hypothetical protein LR68_03350 [Anoxybacillus sp. BCO1]|nr:hypothetical protein LR68_03350 [Anoxybacillus sp. BCO1]